MNRRYLIVFFILSATIYMLFAFCTPKVANKKIDSPYYNVSDSAKYVGINTCKQCHADIYETYIKTGMGKSFDWATASKSSAHFSKHTSIYDSINDLYYHPFFDKDTLYIKEFRLQEKDTIYNRTQAVTYIVGSGQHTNSHLYLINNFLYQAPITFYTQKGIWDLAPGFEKGASTRFTRVIKDECMSCHNSYATLDQESENKYLEIKQGIDCERCHGPGSIHVSLKQNGEIIDTSKSYDYSIVNPRGLSREAQIDVCQRCHLQGITVLQEGMDFHSFLPSMRLKDVMNVFLPRYTDSDQHFLMASHADRMQVSKCFKASDMTCISCHNPHVSVTETPLKHWIQTCENCHKSTPQKLCTEKEDKKKLAENNCVSCHMPLSSTIDIPHVKIHDHNIQIVKKIDTNTTQKIRKFLKLECVNNPNLNALDKAKGYLNYFEEYTQEQEMLDSAQYFLKLYKAKDREDYEVWIHFYYLSNSFDELITYAEKYKSHPLKNAWTYYRIGEAYDQKKNYEKALYHYNTALSIKPKILDFINKKGVALMHLKRNDEAKKVFETVLKENPYYPLSLNNLGYLLVQEGKPEEAIAMFQKALQLDPDYVSCLVNISGAYLLINKPSEAKKYIKNAFKKEPENEEVKLLLKKMQGV